MQGPVMVSMIREKAVDKTVELYMISDTGTLMSRFCNGAWAGHMCFCVHFCGVFVCIWVHFYVHLGGVFVGILWLFCVHFSQFCDLIGIQILHNIHLWHHVAYIFAVRMAEYISAFRYILNKYCNKCVNGPSRPYKAKKIIVVYLIWNVVK